MKLIVNGREKEVNENINIIKLLEVYNIKDFTKVVVELNNEIVEYIQYEKTILRENDNIEIVSFVGGG